MADTVLMNVKVAPELREQFARAAERDGFASASEALRHLMRKKVEERELLDHFAAQREASKVDAGSS